MSEHAPLCVNHPDNKQDDLELLSGLNIAIDYTEETDTVVSLARRQAAFNNAVIALLVQAGVLKPNAGWTQEK